MCIRSCLVAFSLLTGLLIVASAVPTAFAATSPHVSATTSSTSCSACHRVHSAPADSTFLGAADASGSITSSCLSCHNGSDPETSNVASGSADSFGQPSGHTLDASSAGTADIGGCDTCHDAHGSSTQARRIPAKQINGVAVSSAGNQTCLACHATNADWFGPGYPSADAPTRDATGYPVDGTWPGKDSFESTTNAHRLIPESTRTVGISEPIRREQGDCTYCHGAHGGTNDYDSLKATYTVPTQATLASDTADGSYAALCFTCHGGEKPSGFATTPVDIKSFATAGGTGGHSIVTSGGTLPVGAPLPCFECHNPHGSTRQNSSLLSDERGASLSTTNSADVRAFCFTCHTTSDSATGWDSVTSTYTAVPASTEVVGISRLGGVLRLPAIAAHEQATADSCYDCHGDSYAAGGSNVHNPSTAPAANFGTNLASSDGGTVTSDTVDATTTVEASASVDATLSTPTSPTVPATDTLGPTWSDLGTPFLEPTATPLTGSPFESLTSSMPPPDSTTDSSVPLP